MERTFVMIKPDGVQRGIVGTIISRLEAKGLKMVAAQFTVLSEEKVMEHYAEHVEKPFFPSLKAYVMSGPVLTMVWEGRDAIAIVRRLVGATNPAEAAPGTIRGDMGMETGKNVIHASDAPESAAREIGIHFTKDELVTYTRIDEAVLYE